MRLAAEETVNGRGEDAGDGEEGDTDNGREGACAKISS